MNVIWNKVWSDLWHHKVRTVLAALSIAAGVFALGVIFGMIGQLTPGLNRVHQEIVPAHSSLTLLSPIDQDTVDRLKNIEGVADIEPVNELSIRYRLSEDEPWQPARLVQRADYEEQQYNLLQLKEGVWPKRNQVGLDIRAGQYLGLELGDMVTFELAGTDRALPISGKIRHHFVTSPDFGADPFFFVDESGLERFDIPKGHYNQLLLRVEPFSPELTRQVASEIKDRLADSGSGVVVAFYDDDPAEHWGQRFFDGLYLVLQLLAVVSLCMSVVLIYNILAALITQETNQIGVLKAVGGGTQAIIKLYLAGVVVYGVLALTVSLPLGMWVAFRVTAYFLDIFNISYDQFQLSPLAVGVQITAAIGVPMLAALWPILNGSRLTVREAIASYGLSGNFGQHPLDRLVDSVGSRFLSPPQLMTLSNMVRRRGRLGLTQLVLITAGTLFLMVMTLSSSIELTVENELGRRNEDMWLSFEAEHRTDRIETMARQVSGVEAAELRFNRPVSILKAGQRTREAGTGARLIGVPADTIMGHPAIVAGRWLLPEDDRAIVMNEETALDNQLKVGDIVTLNLGELGDKQWQIVGLYRMVSLGFIPDDIFAPQEAIFKATTKHNVGRHLLVQTRYHHEPYVTAVVQQLKERYEGRNYSLQDTQTKWEDQHFFDNFFGQYIPMLLGLAIITAIVGGMGLMGALSISVVERTKEIGVLRAIGAKTSLIMGMLVLEGTLQGLLSWLVAVPLSFVLGQPLAKLMGQALFNLDLDYHYNMQAVFIWLMVVLLISVMASLMPARNATRISVRESLAYA